MASLIIGREKKLNKPSEKGPILQVINHRVISLSSPSRSPQQPFPTKNPSPSPRFLPSAPPRRRGAEPDAAQGEEGRSAGGAPHPRPLLLPPQDRNRTSPSSPSNPGSPTPYPLLASARRSFMGCRWQFTGSSG